MAEQLWLMKHIGEEEDHQEDYSDCCGRNFKKFLRGWVLTRNSGFSFGRDPDLEADAGIFISFLRLSVMSPVSSHCCSSFVTGSFCESV